MERDVAPFTVYNDTKQRDALIQIIAVCDDNANVARKDLALKFVREVASRALTA